MRSGGAAILIVSCCLLGLAAHPARAQSPTALTADTHATQGWIGVRVTGPAGGALTLSEVVDGVAQPFATGTLAVGGTYASPRALAWRCDRRARTLLATVLLADGTSSQARAAVRTPSCAHRFSLRLRPSTAPRVGRRLSVTVRDAWHTGHTAARLCLGRACRPLTVPATAHLRPGRAGLARVELRAPGVKVRRRLEVRGRHARLRLLATGDSMIQIVDSDLKARLRGRARVTSDARVSTGLSKPLLLNWPLHARRQVAARRPEVTVVFIGANDGFAIGGVPCCGARWIGRYAGRVRAMMDDYRRGGAGHVYWLTLPTPRSAAWKRIYHAVNIAIRRAAGGFPADEVTVVDLVRVFTPGERFRASIHGRVVRQGDGVHLNVAGAAIAARLLMRRLRADGFI